MIHNIIMEPWADSTITISDTLSINIDEKEIWSGLAFEALNLVNDIELTSGQKVLNIFKSDQKITSRPITINSYWNFYQISIVHKKEDLGTTMKGYTIDRVLFGETGLD